MRWRWGKKATARPHGDTAGPTDGPGAAFAGGAQPSELPGPVVALLGAVQAMDPKPPVTLAMIGVMYCAHLQLSRVPSLYAAFSLCPDRVVVSQEIRRIFVAPFLHQDELQLYHNMLSLLWKGYNLEKKHGSIHFAATVLYLVVLSQLLVVATAYIIARYAFLLSGTIYECHVGFSGVICALKVILNHNAQTFTRMYNISVPTKYAAWLELLGMYIFMPKLPLATQLCGVTAGYIYTITPPATLVLTKAKGASAYMLELLGLSKKPSRTKRAVEGIKKLGKRVFRQR